MKHTPGPWTLSVANINSYPFWISNDKNETICYVQDKRSNSELSGIEIADANARLIAAAPELLEVAQLVLLMKNDERFTKMPEWITIVDKAEEAFLKATGEKEVVS